MAMTLIEKILALHSEKNVLKPGEIADINIDVRVARDFGGANVVRNLRDSGLGIADPGRTFFTFDCNPTGSDQKYAVNQHICRLYARETGISVFDIDAGIGTHILIEKGLVTPGSTMVSTDSHANIVGAVGAFGQGMGDMDIASAWSSGKVWFKVPESVLLNLRGKLPPGVGAKDIILNLLNIYGASSLLGVSVELGGEVAEKLTLDQRITISSMATEMGAIIILFPPVNAILNYAPFRAGKNTFPVFADTNAEYLKVTEIDTAGFVPMISRPGEPHDTVPAVNLYGTRIDSAFIGSCTNGRIEDMIAASRILKDRKIAPGVVLKIVPSTDEIWKKCLDQGLIKVFKEAGALVSNAGCAGCAAGQVGQNGPGEVTISTGNRNFAGKQGKGSVYLASPEIVAASAVAGFITTPDRIPDRPAVWEFKTTGNRAETQTFLRQPAVKDQEEVQGRIWYIPRDNIDTDMIYHNIHIATTDILEMGRYTFGNLEGYTDFAEKAKSGDIVFAGKNFGSGSSRQQAVDCFKSLGISAIVAESFGAIYERNAINAGFPVITCRTCDELALEEGDVVRVNFRSGKIENLSKNKSVMAAPFSEVQYKIYQRGGLL